MFLIKIAFTLLLTVHSAWCMDAGVCYLELTEDTKEKRSDWGAFSYACTKVEKPDVLVKSDSCMIQILGGSSGYWQALEFEDKRIKALQQSFKTITDNQNELDWIVFLSENKIVGVLSKMQRDMCFQTLRFAVAHSYFNVFPQAIDNFMNLDAIIAQNPVVGLQAYQSILMILQINKKKFTEQRKSYANQPGKSPGEALPENQCSKLIKEEVEKITKILEQYLPLIAEQETLQQQTDDSSANNPAINKPHYLKKIFGFLFILMICSIPTYYLMFSK